MDTTHLTGKELERLAHNVSPGEWAVENQRPIATLLGSCVAVCLYDPQLRLGGLNHFMLPTFERSNNRDFDTMLCGSYAMEALFNGLLGRGARKIVFDPQSGDVFSRRMANNAEASRIALAEAAYRKTLATPQGKGNVELF